MMNDDNKSAVTQQKTNPASTENRDKAPNPALQPLTDILESKDGVTLYLDIPGTDKEQLDIDVDQNVLTIKASIRLDMPDNLEPAYMDIRSGRFERRFTLGEQMDSENIQASLNQGELKVFIPRLAQHKPRKIEVKVA